MWKPPGRIKFQSTLGSCPSVGKAQASLLFSPVKVGPVSLHGRTWVPAMVPWRATNEGYVTPEVLAWYARFAKGQPGALVVEATGIRDIPSGPLLRIGDDRFIPGLADLVDTVKQASGGKTKLFIQIIDFLSIRRRPDAEKFFTHYLEITADHAHALGLTHASEDEVRKRLLTCGEDELERVLTPTELESLRYGYRERVTDTHLPHIQNLPQVLPDLFAQAASRAEKAGFDGVELHYAHAYTMASFLSATNTRDDAYGGLKENRVRLPVQVYQAVRQQTGGDFVVGCRFLAEECIEGGSTLEDSCYFGAEFAKAGMDFISLSRGGKFDDAAQPKVGWAAYPYTGPSGYECMPQHLSDAFGPFGRNVNATSSIRKAIRDSGYETPIVVAGGIHNFDMAEQLLKNQDADIIGAARQSLADPDWFLKIKSGHGDQVRLCEYTNYCEGLDQKHKTVTCKLWDREGLDEPGAIKSEDGKRRLVAPDWKRPASKL